MAIRTFPASTVNSSESLNIQQRLLAASFFLVPLTGISIVAGATLFDLVALLALALNRKTYLRSVPNTQTWIFCGMILAAFCLHITNSEVPTGNAIIFLSGIITCLLAVSVLTTLRSLQTSYEMIIKIYIAGTFISSIYAIAALAAPALTDIPIIVYPDGGPGRAFGLSKHSNLLGIHTAMSLLFMRNIAYSKKGNATLFIVLFSTLIMTGSRSGLILLGTGILLSLFISTSSKERKRLLQALGAMAVGCYVFVNYTVSGKFLYERATGQAGVTGDDERTVLFDLGVKNVQEYWLFGSPYEGRLFHNIYLSYFGILGLLGICALLLFFSSRAFSLWKLRDSAEGRTAFATFLSLLLILTVHNAIAEPVIWFVALSPILLEKSRQGTVMYHQS